MKTKKGDFIEIDFTATVKDGNIFDTTMRNEAFKDGLIAENDKREFKPLTLCIGQGMVVKGLDKELEDKEAGKEYEVELQPKDAFGIRKPNLIRPAPLSAFKERPLTGMFVNVDGAIAKVINVAGGRTLLDFNPPLAGRVVVYKVKINKLINEKDKRMDILAKTFGLKLNDIKIESSKATAKLEKEKSIPVEIQEKALKELKKKVKDIMHLELEIKI